MVNIIGISALYHDSAAALVINGKIISAAQEERFTRKKNDPSFPIESINFCIKNAGLTAEDIDYVAFYEKPFLKFERLLETYATFSPRGFKSFKKAIPIWIKEKLFQKKLILDNLQIIEPNVEWSSKLLFSEHHLSHAASAFFPSPFQRSAILTLDGVGEWTTTSLAFGENNKISINKELHFPHSLGLLYSAFTFYNGFKVNSGEYKLMGLAPYGQPRYTQVILDNLIDLKEDGSFRLNQKYFDYSTGLQMTNNHFHSLFGSPPRNPESFINQRNMDIAASIQSITEEVVLRLAKDIKRQTNEENLCLAGGVALNCVANGKIQSENIFKNLWIQPAANDSGGAIGSALVAYHLHLKEERTIKRENDGMSGSFLGPNFSNSDIEKELIKHNAVYEYAETDKIIEFTSQVLAENKTVGWFQGRMEFGPRALGSRSILANPADNQMQKTLNMKIKFRESFRPFAPAILREDLEEWFDFKIDSPYMSFVVPVQNDQCIPLSQADRELRGIERVNAIRSTIPAVTHVDYSARIQTVDKDTNQLFYNLIKKFKDKTSIPILVNTSFNIRGEPIVCTPEDAYKCFMATGLDFLIIGDFILEKKLQNN